MAKKGNRIQVIMECTEHKASVNPAPLAISLLKIENTLKDWKSRNIIPYSEKNYSQRN